MRLRIRAKLVLFIGLPTLAIAVGVLLWTLNYAEQQTRQVREAEMVGLAENAAARFDDYISKASRVAETTASFLSRVPDLDEARLYGILEDNVTLNRRIYGSAIAFEPGTYKKDDSLFSPYVYQDHEAKPVRLNVGRDVYDWYNDPQWQWWHLPKESGHGVWTDPYFDVGGGDILMTTYSTPFFNLPRGEVSREFRGVTTVDIDLETLHNDIGHEIVGDREFLILGKDGMYIYSDHTEQILKESIYAALPAEARDRVSRMMKGSSGVTIFDTKSEKRVDFAYAPIPSTGWTFVTSIPDSELMAPFYRARQVMVGSFMAAVALVGACILFMSGRLTQPIERLRDRVLLIADGKECSLKDYRTGDELEDLAGAFGTMQAKVTDREAKLENARERTLDELMESAPDAMIIVNTEGRICRVNSAAEELFGFDHHNLSGAQVESLVPERYRDGHLAGYFSAVKNREAGIGFELHGQRRDGSEFPVEIGLSPFHDPEGLMAVAAIRDITGRKKSEQKLHVAREQAETANRAKSEFLSHMSHELRTPLNGILGYAQILQRHPDATESQNASLGAIVNCGDHLLSLINDVLDLSKIEAGRIEVDPAPCDLHKLVKGVSDIVQQRASGKGLGFELEVSSEVPIGIVTDAPKVRQILVNLLGNAVKFTAKGTVTLHVAELPKGYLQFDVIDTGVGMSEAELQEIFDPFKQVEAGKAEGGTGLGLAISKRLAEVLGGEIAVVSEKGVGSTFTVRIPLEEVGAEELSTMDADPTRDAEDLVLVEGQDLTVLVADDRLTNREILEQMLDHAGFKTILADDGDIALERLEEQHIDVVLMDVRMPRMNGIEALKRIRANEKTKDLPVIAVTASVFPEFREKALAEGFNDFLGKPFRVSELMAVLRSQLKATFVDRAVKKPAIAEPVSTAGSIEDLPPEALEKLRAALKIRNLTAINALAAELAGVPSTAAIGKEIGRHAKRFDFDGLKKIVEGENA